MNQDFFASTQFKKFMSKVYGFGASVVIVGALFKIEHFKGADVMLMVGLGTEAIIFALSAFEPLHKETDWTLVYPELAGIEENKGTVSQQLDKMLAESKVGPELISSLGNGLKSLSDNVNSFKDLSNATIATDNYTKSVQQASLSITGMNSSYAKAVEGLNGMVSATEGSKEYGVQIDKMTKNLSSLNSVYELEIKESNNHLKSINEFVGNLSKAVTTLSETHGETESFKTEMGKLSKNLTALNNVYGNMLSAMNINSSSR